MGLCHRVAGDSTRERKALLVLCSLAGEKGKMTRQEKHGDSKGKRMAIPETHVRFPRVSRPERVVRAARCKGSSVIMWFVAVRSGTRDPRGLENLLQDCEASSATGRNRGIPGN